MRMRVMGCGEGEEKEEDTEGGSRCVGQGGFKEAGKQE